MKKQAEKSLHLQLHLIKSSCVTTSMPFPPWPVLNSASRPFLSDAELLNRKGLQAFPLCAKEDVNRRFQAGDQLSWFAWTEVFHRTRLWVLRPGLSWQTKADGHSRFQRRLKDSGSGRVVTAVHERQGRAQPTETDTRQEAQGHRDS